MESIFQKRRIETITVWLKGGHWTEIGPQLGPVSHEALLNYCQQVVAGNNHQ
jgi:hypothetical protein